MKLSTECLEVSQVDSLLLGNLTPEEYESAQDHLELCETCRARVEATIGPEQWWSDVKSVLRSDASLHVAASLRDAEDFRAEETGADATSLGETRLREKLLDMLGPTDDPNMLGRIGPYEIIGLLGQGGMGAVFKGFDRSLNRFVAIKMLLPHLAASGAARKRFAREGQAVAAVVDDHVMAIHCVDEWQGVPFLVMTYSRGVSLQKRLSDNGPLEVREILRIGMQAAKGLAAAHAQGIVHRDIKPANIFLDQSVERVQLMDFGLARAVDDASLTRSGTLAGTPQYMSPEQARAETVDHRSDLFSLGSVMYAMCTGHAPFRAESSYSVLRLITDKEPRPVREINPDVPEWLCSIIYKLMAKQASDRFESAQELAKLLEDCLAHVQQPTIASLPENVVQKSTPRAFAFRSRTFGVFAMFAVVCSVIVAMLLMQSPDKPNQDGVRDAGGVQVTSTDQADARDAGISNLTELLEMQKQREKSLRQLRLLGNIRQTQQIETKRIEGESNEEYIKRYTSPERSFDGLGPFPMLIERDYNAVSGHIKYGDLNGKLPIMFREWFFKGDVFTQLMGVEDGHGQATITKKPADELRQPWSGWIRADVYAFRPILDHELSTVLDKAAHMPGIPDPAGRPLFHLDKKKSADQKVQWIATFLHQEPSDVNGRTTVEHLWYRVFWEQVDKEVLITRVDELSVVGGADSMPLRVALVDDYRTIDSVKIPHRVRTYMFANPSGLLGAELVASEVKVNDAVDMPTQLQIPPGTSVTDELTGKKFRQPVDEPKSRQDSPKAPISKSQSTTINPNIPAEGKPIDKDKLLNVIRERDAKFSRHSVELERTWDTLTSPRSEASQYRHNSLRFGQADPGIPEGLPEDYQQPHRIRYIWTGQNFESTLEILVDYETAIHPEHGKLESRSIESDCFSYYRYWNRDLEIFSHSSDIARLSGGKKAWEYLLPSGFGITHSILSISNAVEVDDGYVLKGLITLPSATIGSRKNCFEIHVDKEMILRKAVIQYHVYDFVIVTTGRSEFVGMPPLAKHAAVSIHHIGQDEKRLGDVGNYKYELIALSEKLSKDEYDMRVNFAIPKGTKLSAGLNLVEVNLDGLPGVRQIERDVPASRPAMTPRAPDQAMNIPKPKRLQIREATGVDAGTDSSQQSVESKVVEFSGMRLRLDPAQPAILTEDDIMTVESVTDPNNLQASQIVLTLTPEAGERFLTETTRLSSQPTPGYLVMEFDGTILSAPRVNDKIGSKVAISTSKDDDMERLVAAIRESIPTQPTPIQRIQRGLTSNQSDAQKAQYLRQFFSVGESYAEVLKRLQVSEPGGVKGGPLQTDIAFDSCDLVLSFDAERKLFRIGYYVHSPALQSPEYHELVPDLWVKVKADRQIVNDVVRAFMKDAGDVETTKTLTRDLPQAVTAKLFSLAAENALNELPMEFDYVNDSAEPTKAIATLIALTFEPQSIGLTKEVFVVFRLTMTDDGWLIDDIDFESKEDADRERKSFLNANPNSVPSITQMKLDRSNARSVVEAYIALALSGDIAKAAALAKNGHATADSKRIAEIPDFLNVQRLKIQTVYVNDPANPKKALATSAAVKLEEEHKQPNGQRDGFMVFTLELTEDKWSVIDIDFESESGAEKELKRFLEANPKSIALPPLTAGEVVVQNANVSAPPAGDAAKAAPAESPLLVEARKALQACQNSLSWKQKFDMRVTNSYVHSQVGKVTIESRVRRDAPRMVESSLQTFDDQPKDHIRLDNWRLDDGEMFIGRTTTVGQKKLTGLMTIKGRQKASWRMFESSSSFAMEGHFPGNQGRTLMEILMESKEPDVRMEKIGEHDCLRISDRNDWGTMTVWIDAGPSRRLRQWESSKERGNRFADGRVGEDKDTANLESFSYFVEDIQYQVLDGIEIAVSCRLRSTSIPNGGTKQETSTEYKRTEIHLRPDFAINNPFVGDFDNGARINDGDAFDRDAAFRWQDGKLTVLSGQASGSGLAP